MKPRKSKDISKILSKKGFVATEDTHHSYYHLFVDGKKSHIYTYLSHGSKEYSKNLMGNIKKQLKFDDSKKADEFLDCTFTEDQYIKLLKSTGELE